MNASSILNFLCQAFLGAEFGTEWQQLVSIALSVLYLTGLWGIFQKCGGKGWWALVPLWREAKLGEVADHSLDGRVAASVTGLIMLTDLVTLLVPETMPGYLVFDTVMLIVGFVLLLVRFVYLLRIYQGLVELFGLKRFWILLWLFADWLPASLCGLLKKYQPAWTLRDLEDGAAAFFSGSKAAVLDQGLTVNLEERTATEFFKKKYLLRDIHMYIQPGHMVLLLGGSGAGKTTYLNAVNGYEKAKAEVVLNGRNMYKDYRDMQYDIGFVPQQDLMRGSDSVFRTLMDAASLRLPATFTKAERRARVHEVMEIFGLLPVQGNLVDKLSGGQRKRLSIAMEFISNPSLFILDEPDSGLDGVMARELFQQLRGIADQGKIIIVITHTPDRVIDLFDDVIVLAKDASRTGRLAYFGPIEEARAFFGKSSMEEIVKTINRTEEGGEGRADEFILKYAEVQHA